MRAADAVKPRMARAQGREARTQQEGQHCGQAEQRAEEHHREDGEVLREMADYAVHAGKAQAGGKHPYGAARGARQPRERRAGGADADHGGGARKFGTSGRTRTDTSRGTTDFESAASTSSATEAPREACTIGARARRVNTVCGG